MDNWWHKRRKIATLPQVTLTPVVVLGRTLEKAQGHVTHADGSKESTVKSVYLGVEFWDGTFVYDYSKMSVKDMLMHREMLDMRIREVLTGIAGEVDAPHAG